MKRALLPLLALFCLPPAVAEELPAYLRLALLCLNCEPPAGWSCTLTSTREGRVSVEHYDPARPADQQWSLLQTNGHPATLDESERYARYRVTTNSTQPHPVFRRGDIDLATAHCLRDAPNVAEYSFRFREGLADTLMAHLELRVTVNKSGACATQSILRLLEPYSPVLGLRIDRLEVTTALSPPIGKTPQLPGVVRSCFHARFLYFRTIEENLVVRYSDFHPAPTVFLPSVP